MAQTFQSIDDALAEWIARQRVFFVATAPLSANGHVNCSPKGGDSLRVLGGRDVAYVDGAGSGIETVAHLRENGRLVLMFCAFDGPPRIVRLHGVGSVVVPADPGFAELQGRFPAFPTIRAIIRLAVQRVSDSCGYGVPRMDFREERDDTRAYLRKSSDEALRKYLARNNERSIDGLPGLTAPELRQLVINRD